MNNLTMTKILPAALSCLTLFLFSCTDDYNICGSSKVVKFVGGFYSATTASETAAPAQSLSLSLINGTNIFTSIPNAASFATSLNPGVDSVQYIISLSDTLPKDTLTIKYSTQIVLVSADCGNVDAYTILQAYSTSNTIKRVAIGDPTVYITGAQNVKIFY